MPSDMNTTTIEYLADKFPQFWFAHAADSLLMRCNSRTLSEQLIERRISKVTILPLFSNGGLSIGEDNNFCIMLNDTLTLDERAHSLGHEIGHTFHHNLTKSPPQNILQASDGEKAENFCNSFAELWLEHNTMEKVVKWLKNPD